MNKISKLLLLIGTLMLAAAMLIGCGTLPELPTRTPQAEPIGGVAETESTESAAEPEETATESSGIAAAETESADSETAVEYVIVTMEAGAAAKAVDLLGAWVEAGAPETAAFDYIGRDGDTHQGFYAVDIQPLFSNTDIWFDGSRACDSCHFANNAASAHEMDLSNYAGVLAGADVMEDPPGVSILGESTPGAGDFDWDHSKLRARLRNNRMPPGWEFDVTEENRDGPTLDVNGSEVRAVDLIAEWVESGVPETATFGDNDATFDANVLPLFTEDGVWFEGAQACTGCHFSNSENSYHEMDLSSYEGILAGADVLEEPPGVSILGETVSGAGDFDWDHSKLNERLRNNRMPPGWEFDITEENRDGPWVLHGTQMDDEMPAAGVGITAVSTSGGACEVKAVNLIGDWVNAGAPESLAFAYIAENGTSCGGTFATDILPLFTEDDIWFDGAQACTGCHFANSENSYHEMDLSSYAGIIAGADVLEEPPGVSILGQSEPGVGDYDWSHSKLHARLRNNRMPPGWEFDITEENRDGPTLPINGTEVRAVDLIADWVNAGVPETTPFGDYDAVFADNVLPLFTEDGVWFDGSQACVGCHFANSENSYHEMDLSSYAGILAGADVLEEPPGVSLLGESEAGAGDYDWDHSKLNERLRNNRMPPGWEFDITEENRDGALVMHGARVGTQSAESDINLSADSCAVRAVNLLADWVNAGAPEGGFSYTAESGDACDGTFDANVLPLFTENNVWFDGAQACTGCHFANSENSYHEMDLSSYEGILAGADVLEEPPGVSILGESVAGAGDFDWSHSKLQARLRNNRMPPGWEFDITEENRDGPTLTINGNEVRAVDLIADWVNSGVPETDAFGDYGATFDDNVLPLFTENGAWFEGSQACSGCHFANSENSYHEMDLTTYEGVLAGADVLEEPPGVSILGESVAGAGDFDWDHSKLNERLRNNRMPPGWEFDITEENRDGPLVSGSGAADEVELGVETAVSDDCAVTAVNIIGDWVNAGVPETELFSYAAASGTSCDGTFETDILPLFTENGVWFDGAQACTGCHFANSENSYHEMDLTTYEGILAGADVLEEPPGVSILGETVSGAGDYDWSHSKLRARLRNNRMPPGWEFDITEENRDGPTLTIGGVDVRAVDLIADWVNAGVPETDAFGDYGATFDANVLPLFTEHNAWFDGSQACVGCHFANSENSYHEMDLSSYEGILAGADVLEEPPGVSLLGESEAGAGDYDWDHSKLNERLRNNRMPPGWEFDITEENRDGPLVLHGLPLSAAAEAAPAVAGLGECEVTAVNLIAAWVNAGAPPDVFDFLAEDGSQCAGNFDADVLPLFTENNVWFDGAQACTGCHFANSENSYHEMDLSSYEGVLAGADVLEEPPGVSILGESVAGAGDFDWSHSKLRARLRNNRMPPGWEFDITEENRDGPMVTINGTEVPAVEVLADWVNAGVPETDTFGDYSATFAENVLPLFTENDAWFEGGQSCDGCHFSNSEFSDHEMDLSNYAGILAGADVLEEPPGVSILGESEPGAGDYGWSHSKLRERLRNNRMPPGWEFDPTEGNRNGPIVLAGVRN